MDWFDDSVEERGEDMSSLVVGFAARMCKRATSAHGETTPTFEQSSGKRPNRYGPDEEAHKSLAIITVDSPDGTRRIK